MYPDQIIEMGHDLITETFEVDLILKEICAREIELKVLDLLAFSGENLLLITVEEKMFVVVHHFGEKGQDPKCPHTERICYPGTTMTVLLGIMGKTPLGDVHLQEDWTLVMIRGVRLGMIQEGLLEMIHSPREMTFEGFLGMIQEEHMMSFEGLLEMIQEEHKMSFEGPIEMIQEDYILSFEGLIEMIHVVLVMTLELPETILEVLDPCMTIQNAMTDHLPGVHNLIDPNHPPTITWQRDTGVTIGVHHSRPLIEDLPMIGTVLWTCPNHIRIPMYHRHSSFVEDLVAVGVDEDSVVAEDDLILVADSMVEGSIVPTVTIPFAKILVLETMGLVKDTVPSTIGGEWTTVFEKRGRQ